MLILKKRKDQVVFKNQTIVKLEDRHFHKVFNVHHALHGIRPNLILVPQKHKELVKGDKEFFAEIYHSLMPGGEVHYYPDEEKSIETVKDGKIITLEHPCTKCNGSQFAHKAMGIRCEHCQGWGTVFEFKAKEDTPVEKKEEDYIPPKGSKTPFEEAIEESIIVCPTCKKLCYNLPNSGKDVCYGGCDLSKIDHENIPIAKLREYYWIKIYGLGVGKLAPDNPIVFIRNIRDETIRGLVALRKKKDPNKEDSIRLSIIEREIKYRSENNIKV